MAILGTTATVSSRHLSHYLSFVMTTIFLIFLLLYLFHHARSSRVGISQYSPFFLVFFSTFFILADPLRHLLQDLHLWLPPSSSEYRRGCSNESISCLSLIGWIFTIGCTYLGFAGLIIGMMWNAQIGEKWREIKEKWREIRREEDENDRDDESPPTT